MKRTSRGIFQIVFLFAFVFLLIRFFPLVVRLTEATAMGLQRFWWGVLVVALGGWLIWVLRKRNPW